MMLMGSRPHARSPAFSTAWQQQGQEQQQPVSWQLQQLPAAACGAMHAGAAEASTAASSVSFAPLLPRSNTTVAAAAAAAADRAGSSKAACRAAAASRAALASALVLAWLPEKHDAELSSMKGQSSTWYFLEKFTISALCLNVTVALTSSFRTTADAAPGMGAAAAPAAASGAEEGAGNRGQQGGGSTGSAGGMLDEMQRMLVKGMVNRLSGDSGLQLINVSDVGLQLGAVDLQNRLLNQVGLASHLYRHYRWAAVAQSRKVLGGVGPGLTQIPAR
jgi:hypothetical protein